MATVIIGSARHDENNKYNGGAVGDQLQTSSTNDTKGEVSMQNFYVHSKGWYILRAKSATHANGIATAMKRACNNVNIGYDQGNRLGIIKYGTATTTKTECDCSALIRQCVIEATGKDAGNFTTANEVTKLMATGLFDKYTYTSGTTLYTGDILVTKSQGHTVAVVSGVSRSTASTTSSSTTHVQLNYKAGQGYCVCATSLNVRSTPSSASSSNKLGKTLTKGTWVKNMATTRVGNAIWMQIPSDYVNGKYTTQWICADSGTTCYVQEGQA